MAIHNSPGKRQPNARTRMFADRVIARKHFKNLWRETLINTDSIVGNRQGPPVGAAMKRHLD